MPFFKKKPIVIQAELAEVRTGVQTKHGLLFAEPGDWIITNKPDDRYPCKPDIFAATYDPVTVIDSDIIPKDTP